MTDALTEDEYREEVEDMAERIASEAQASVEEGPHADPNSNVETAVHEFAEEDLEHHNWFARTYYDGSLYGSIVGHSEADVARYTDWQALIESDDPEKTLKRLGLVCMEADVIEAAYEELDGE